MTSKHIDMEHDDTLPAANTIQNPVKPAVSADPNLVITTDESDNVSVMSNGTETTKERSCCSDHDGSGSDHECNEEIEGTTYTVKSILKEPEADWDSIRSEGPWKRLSEPMLPIGPLREKPTKIRHQRSVSFDSVQLRKYNQTLGDNPCVYYGPPIQLDWKYDEELVIPVDDYECRDRKWIFRQQMVMNAYKRKSLLNFYYGFTEEELKQSEKMVQKIQRQRSWTKALEPVYIIEDFVSSTYRRIKLAANKRRRARSQSF